MAAYGLCALVAVGVPAPCTAPSCFLNKGQATSKTLFDMMWLELPLPAQQ